MDRMVGYLVDVLKKHNLHDVLNILVVADHGQVEVFPSQTIFLDEHVDRALYFGYQDTPVFSIFPHKDDDIPVIMKKLEKVEHLTVYTKDKIPEKYHYRNNKRIPPILLMADVGWNVAQNKTETPYWETTIGEHGYGNDVSKMWPTFVASGPAFRKGIMSEPFSSTDIYSLICHILRIEPRPHNGSIEHVKHLFADGLPSHQPSVLRASLGVVTFLLVVVTSLMLLSCSLMLKYRTEARSVRRLEEAEGLLDEDLEA
ncbi:ectonucleotide pyrophosphatase/phosphodiesterase family member 5-like isoform X3 [Apostichopus japonicus]